MHAQAFCISWHPHQGTAILFGMSDVTSILSQIEEGDPQAPGKLLPCVHAPLSDPGGIVAPSHCGVTT
jgi:hypothetical protein